MNGVFSLLIFNILKKYINFILTSHFYQKEQNVKKLVANLHDKTESHSYKKFKTSIKSKINFEKSS